MEVRVESQYQSQISKYYTVTHIFQCFEGISGANL